jgi:hypothetical protein
MGIFGWSYPPGCDGPSYDDLPCSVCGLFEDQCICPECPKCASVGDPKCYEENGHGLTLSPEQIASYIKQLEKWEKMKNG